VAARNRRGSAVEALVIVVVVVAVLVVIGLAMAPKIVEQ
jgi:hypothetical protein